IAIEVKSTANPNSKHMKGLRALAEENICKKYYLVCSCSHNKIIDNIHVIHWNDFLEKLWLNKLI
ncbi:MAG: ATP-binding protein, partial [Gammaproteobacteria bacterium]|nr:ATP-binding protein [Gammaproteobacteria bacterium]